MGKLRAGNWKACSRSHNCDGFLTHSISSPLCAQNICSSLLTLQPNESNTFLKEAWQVTGFFQTLSLQENPNMSWRKESAMCVQPCPTLCDPVDWSPPGSSVHGDSPGKNTGVGWYVLPKGIFLTEGSNPGFQHCRWVLYLLSHQVIP